MGSVLEAVTVSADVATLIAFVIALAGIGERWLTRPRPAVEVRPEPPTRSPSPVIVIENKGGARALRHVGLRYVVTPVRYGSLGDDGPAWKPELRPGEHVTIQFHDSSSHFFGSAPRHNEERFPLDRGQGIMIELSWDGPVLPWRRGSRVVLWSSEDREAGRAPVVLKGRQARAAFAKARQAPVRRRAAP